MKVLLAMVALGAAAGSASGQVSLGMWDNFNSGTTHDWINGGSAPDPDVISSGGPAGAGDGWMRMSSDGSGGGGKLTIFNNLDWWGDYVTTGITRIEMDLMNLDPQNRTLNIRLGFRLSSNQNSPGWCTQAFNLVADGQWHHAVFTLSAATMTRIGGAPSWTESMMSVGEVRLSHSPSAGLTGPNITSAMGVDNIRALPTPGAAGVLMLGGLLTSRRRR
ncbi:MAG: hypothetical protein ACREJO_17055 [Phycisphaerales bacterium]